MNDRMETKKESVRRSKASRQTATTMTLKELRQARKVTQVELAKRMELGQGHVSLFESRKELRLDTIRRYVEALGGELSLVVEFKDHQPIKLKV
jgi:transcriptional regulator with XRE-family HTH domain